jgi:hypothetical protein
MTLVVWSVVDHQPYFVVLTVARANKFFVTTVAWYNINIFLSIVYGDGQGSSLRERTWEI